MQLAHENAHVFASFDPFRPQYWLGLTYFLQAHKNNLIKRGGEAGSSWRARGPRLPKAKICPLTVCNRPTANDLKFSKLRYSQSAQRLETL